MNLPPNTRSAFAPIVDASTLRSSSAGVMRGEGVDGNAFAGLLQSQARVSSGGTYHGSAFDVPEARREPMPKPAEPASRARPAAMQDGPRQAPVRENTGPRTARADASDGSEAEPAPQRRAQATSERRDGPRPERRGVVREEQARVGASAGADAAAEGAAADAASAPIGKEAAGNESALLLPAATPQNQPVLDWLPRFGRGIASADGQATGTEAGALGNAAGLPLPAAAGVASLMGVAGTEPATGSATEAAARPVIATSADAATPVAQTAMGQNLGAEALRPAMEREMSQAAAAPAGAALAVEPAAIDASRTEAPMGSQLAPPSPHVASTAPVQATIAAPLASPDFAAALAARLTTLANEGVQHAELQLNPAEMGPIAVQIVVDGTQAQIEFSAPYAETRDALAASLPSLAASLHAAGLTLSGGGVSDQRQERPSGDGAPAHSTAQQRDTAGAAAGSPVPPRAARGLLDLYA